MYIFILLILVFCVIALFIDAWILLWLKKKFKIKNPTYKNSITIIIISSIASFVAGIFFGIINLGLLSDILAIIIIFFTFYFFLKKYYQSDWKKSLVIFISFSVIASALTLTIVTSIRSYIVEPFFVEGETMSPTYNNGDYLLINKTTAKFDRSDIIIARNPKDQDQFLIKRIIGLPYEKVEIKNGNVFIDRKILNEEYLTEQTFGDISTTLNSDQYFILGDNRNKSLDSRFFGPISLNDIEGKIFYKVSNFAK